MQTMILGGIAAAICWVAWQRHNHLLDKQAADSGRALKPVPAGFDYQAAREEADRMESNLRQYEQCNQLINDSVVAIQTGEGMPIEITHFDNGGKRVQYHADRHPTGDYQRLCTSTTGRLCRTVQHSPV